jgi:hypothetical protein
MEHHVRGNEPQKMRFVSFAWPYQRIANVLAISGVSTSMWGAMT